jgi:hypothetical protein
MPELTFSTDTAVLGWLFFIGYCITTGLTVRHGGGIHQWNVRAGEAIKAAFVSFRDLYFAEFERTYNIGSTSTHLRSYTELQLLS